MKYNNSYNIPIHNKYTDYKNIKSFNNYIHHQEIINIYFERKINYTNFGINIKKIKIFKNQTK